MTEGENTRHFSGEMNRLQDREYTFEVDTYGIHHIL